jgi:hypothetical protein
MNFLELPDWKRMFIMILNYCDFKTVLMLNCSCKKFINLCQNERNRRSRIYSSNPSKFEKSDSVFYGVKCGGIPLSLEYREENGTVRINHHQIKLECHKHCYVSGFKNGFCKNCNAKKLEINFEQALMRDCFYNGSRFSHTEL